MAVQAAKRQRAFNRASHPSPTDSGPGVESNGHLCSARTVQSRCPSSPRQIEE
jgi:hypothetical protein